MVKYFLFGKTWLPWQWNIYSYIWNIIISFVALFFLLLLLRFWNWKKNSIFFPFSVIICFSISFISPWCYHKSFNYYTFLFELYCSFSVFYLELIFNLVVCLSYYSIEKKTIWFIFCLLIWGTLWCTWGGKREMFLRFRHVSLGNLTYIIRFNSLSTEVYCWIKIFLWMSGDHLLSHNSELGIKVS